MQLSIRGLPADEDAVYEVLCDAETWTATAGTFRTDAKGHAYVIVTTALRQGRVRRDPDRPPRPPRRRQARTSATS